MPNVYPSSFGSLEEYPESQPMPMLNDCLVCCGHCKSGALEYNELGKKTAVGCGKGHSFRHQVKCKGEQKSGASLDCCAKMSMIEQKDAESQFEIMGGSPTTQFFWWNQPKEGKTKKHGLFSWTFPGIFQWYLMITERKFATVFAMCWFTGMVIGTSHMGKGFRIPIASCPTSGKRWSCIAVKMPYSELEVYCSCHCVSEMP